MRKKNDTSNTDFTGKVKLEGKNVSSLSAIYKGVIMLSCKKAFNAAEITRIKLQMKNGNYYAYDTNIKIKYNEKTMEEGNFVPQYNIDYPYMEKGPDVILNAYSGARIVDRNFESQTVYYYVKPTDYFKNKTVTYTVNNVYVSDENIELTSVQYTKLPYIKNQDEIYDIDTLEYVSDDTFTCSFQPKETNIFSGFIMKMTYNCKVNLDAQTYGCDTFFDVTVNNVRNTYDRFINVFRYYSHN